jgi:hypothetical protein
MATENTDSMTLAVQAMAAMDANAARIRAVVPRLLAEHAENLPPLLSVRTQATGRGAEVALQPWTVEAANEWARALCVELVCTEEVADDGWHTIRSAADTWVEGVRVHLGTSESFSPAQWAEREAVAVSA